MRNLPKVTKYLLIANFALWFLDMLLEKRFGVRLTNVLGLYYFQSNAFHVWQPLTYMFMHASMGHILCNMFALWMFGPVIENEWGSKKFALYYLICGLGAALVQEVVWGLTGGAYSIIDGQLAFRVTIGASGAVFGILFAFGWLFPDIRLYLFLLPIPIRARVFVIIYAAFELFAGLAPSAGDNVAHFAHLGGMLFGWLLILFWKYVHWPPIRREKSENSLGKDYSNYHYHRNIN